MNRAFDVILWGATGFTGRLVARYITQRYGCAGSLHWALAGRNLHKLEDLRAQLTQINPEANHLTLLVASSEDQLSLETLAAQTQVICSTVGPYSRYGSALVAACVAQNTHYCDLAGELTWIREMIDRHHEQALAQQLRIVHSCGMDSIPSDLGCFMMQEAMLARYGVPCREVRFYLSEARGGFSGGTVASLIALIEAFKEPRYQDLWLNPYALNPQLDPTGRNQLNLVTVSWDCDQNQWVSPYIMAVIDTPVVYRSQALQISRYGPIQDLQYSEVTLNPQGLYGWFQAVTSNVLLDLFLGLLLLPPIRSLLQASVLPSPGEGPSQALQESGYFKIKLMAKSGPHQLKGIVQGVGDPGYRCTSQMLAESAICLVQDQADLPEHFGVLTPATAMGLPLLNRLRQSGITFEVL